VKLLFLNTYFYFLIVFSLSLVSCGSEEKPKEEEPIEEVKEDDLNEALKKSTSEKPAMDSVELKASVKKIEAKYGEQWDFCDCVVKGDSINKAFMKPNLPDKEFERLSKRFDEIDKKCQAFRIQDANRTPEERAIHEKKVRKCLKAAGIKG
jgi:hypothetical protein